MSHIIIKRYKMEKTTGKRVCEKMNVSSADSKSEILGTKSKFMSMAVVTWMTAAGTSGKWPDGSLKLETQSSFPHGDQDPLLWTSITAFQVLQYLEAGTQNKTLALERGMWALECQVKCPPLQDMSSMEKNQVMQSDMKPGNIHTAKSDTVSLHTCQLLQRGGHGKNRTFLSLPLCVLREKLQALYSWK